MTTQPGLVPVCPSCGFGSAAQPSPSYPLAPGPTSPEPFDGSAFHDAPPHPDEPLAVDATPGAAAAFPWPPTFPGGTNAGAKVHGKAVAALVLGALSIFLSLFGILTGILAVVLGALAWRDIKRSQGMRTGKGLAGTGLGLGILAILIWGIAFIAVLAEDDPAGDAFPTFHAEMDDAFAAYDRGDHARSATLFERAEQVADDGYVATYDEREDVWSQYKEAAALCHAEALELRDGKPDGSESWSDCVAAYEAGQALEADLPPSTA